LAQQTRIVRSRSLLGTSLQQGYPMPVVAWIVLGLISGFMAGNIVRSTGLGLLLDIAGGLMGPYATRHRVFIGSQFHAGL